MKKILARRITPLLLMSIMILAFNVAIISFAGHVVGTRTITVPDDYSTIQDAINAAASGDTIYVKAGTYNEDVVVNNLPDIKLIGESIVNTIIKGTGTGDAVTFFSPHGTMSGFTVRGSGNTYAGIRFVGVGGVLSGNRVTDNCDGIEIYGEDCQVIGNLVTGNSYGGIFVTPGSRRIVLRDNVMTNNRYNFGVNVQWTVVAYSILEYWMHDIDTSNTVDGKPVYYLVNQHNLEIPMEAGYVAAINCSFISAVGLNLKGNAQGVVFAFTNSSLVREVDASNNIIGLCMRSSNNSKLLGNHLSNNNIAIHLFSSSANIIDGNKLEGFPDSVGIASTNSDSNTVVDNTISEFEYGVKIHGGESNLVCHNNFIGNAYHAEVSQSNSVWDDGYPSGGNYWSDYAGVDLKSGKDQNDIGSDGIGDTPRAIDSEHRDRYPLMQPFPKSVNLEVPYQSQGILNWCATTSLVMALRYYGVATHNWVIAEYLGEGRDEGAVFGPDIDEQSIWPLKRLSDFLVSNYPTYKIGYYRKVTAQIFHDMRGNLSLGRPVLLALRKSPSEPTGHIIVVTGFNSSGIFFSDPSGAAGEMCDKVIWLNPSPGHWNGYYGFVETNAISPIICTSYQSGLRYLNTGTLLILSGNPSPTRGSLELHTYDAENFYIQACSFYIDKPLPLLPVYLDLDNGLKWESSLGVGARVSVGNPVVGKSDTMNCNVYLYNHAGTSQDFTVLYTIRGYDGITYYMDLKIESLGPRSKDYYAQAVTLGGVLTKTQYYHIQLQLLDSEGNAIDTISIPGIYYFVSGTSGSLEESRHHLYLHVYDSEGRHVGLNHANNETEIEVPNSYYFDNSNGTITIILPTYNSSFLFVVDGTVAEDTMESYDLTVITVNNGMVIDQNSTQGTIEKGAQTEYNFQISQSGKIVTVPELPSVLVLPVLMIATLLAGRVYRKKPHLLKERA